LYEIAKNLPYIISTEELDRLFTLLLENLSGNQKIYFENLYERKHYWSRAYNKLNSLDSHCTGIVENINKHLKQHVGLKCSLVEYFYRVILFTTEFNNHDTLSIEETISYETYKNLFQHSHFFVNAKPYVSEYALKKLVVNGIKSMSWTIDPRKPLEMSKGDNIEIKYTLFQDENNLLSCPCTSFLSLGLPCEHILKALTHQQKESQILQYVNQRWFSSEEGNVDPVSKEIKDMIEIEKKFIPGNLNEEEEKEKEEEEKSQKKEPILYLYLFDDI